MSEKETAGRSAEWCEDNPREAAAEIAMLRKHVRSLAAFINGHIPDRNTQTPEEVAATEDYIAILCKGAHAL